MTLLLTDRGPFRWMIWPDLEDGITTLSMTGLDTNTPNDAATPGDHASISVGYPSGVTAWTSEAWGVGTFGDDTYGTGSSPTDYTASDGATLLWEGLGDDGNTYRASAGIRYAEGTAPAVADGQNWTVDDTSINIDGSASGTGLTFSYALSGIGDNGTVDINSSTGQITGTPTSTDSGTATITATDQYGRTLQDTFTFTIALRTQATGGTDLDLSYPEDSAITPQDLLANWTANGNTLSFVSVSPSLPTGLSINSSGTLSGTPTTITADDTYTLTMEDEYGRETSDTFTLEITAVSAEEITFGTATYTRGTAGVAPELDIADVVATGFSGGTFTLYWATRDSGDAELSKANIENGTGDAIDSGSYGPEADIADLANAVIDLSTSLTSDNIDFFFEHSGGTSSDVGSAGSVTYDAVAPAFSSAVVENAAPSDLVITLTKAAYEAGTLAPADFTLGGTYGGSISTATLTDTTTITLGLSTPVANGDTLTVALTDGAVLVGVDAEAVATWTAESVTNNVSASGLTLELIDVSSVTSVGGGPCVCDFTNVSEGDQLYACVTTQGFGSAAAISALDLEGTSMTAVTNESNSLRAKSSIWKVTCPAAAAGNSAAEFNFTIGQGANCVVHVYRVVGTVSTETAAEDNRDGGTPLDVSVATVSGGVLLGAVFAEDDSVDGLTDLAWTGATSDNEINHADGEHNCASATSLSTETRTVTIASDTNGQQSASVVALS